MSNLLRRTMIASCSMFALAAPSLVAEAAPQRREDVPISTTAIDAEELSSQTSAPDLSKIAPRWCPPRPQPINVGSNGRVGSGAQFKKKAVGALTSLAGGLLGGGGGGGGGRSSGPQTVRCKIKNRDMSVFSDPLTGVELQVGARRKGDNVEIFSRVKDSPDRGTFQTAYVERENSDYRTPIELGMCDLYGEFKLTVSWTKDTYVNGEHVDHQEGGWSKIGNFKIPGMVSTDEVPAGYWRMLGFSNASAGARQIRTTFAMPEGSLTDQPVAFTIHVTQPSQDPVMTVPFTIMMQETADGFTFTDVPQQCSDPALVANNEAGGNGDDADGLYDDDYFFDNVVDANARGANGGGLYDDDYFFDNVIAGSSSQLIGDSNGAAIGGGKPPAIQFAGNPNDRMSVGLPRIGWSNFGNTPVLTFDVVIDALDNPVIAGNEPLLSEPFSYFDTPSLSDLINAELFQPLNNAPFDFGGKYEIVERDYGVDRISTIFGDADYTPASSATRSGGYSTDDHVASSPEMKFIYTSPRFSPTLSTAKFELGSAEDKLVITPQMAAELEKQGLLSEEGKTLFGTRSENATAGGSSSRPSGGGGPGDTRADGANAGGGPGGEGGRAIISEQQAEQLDALGLLSEAAKKDFGIEGEARPAPQWALILPELTLFGRVLTAEERKTLSDRFAAADEAAAQDSADGAAPRLMLAMHEAILFGRVLEPAERAQFRKNLAVAETKINLDVPEGGERRRLSNLEFAEVAYFGRILTEAERNQIRFDIRGSLASLEGRSREKLLEEIGNRRRLIVKGASGEYTIVDINPTQRSENTTAKATNNSTVAEGADDGAATSAVAGTGPAAERILSRAQAEALNEMGLLSEAAKKQFGLGNASSKPGGGSNGAGGSASPGGGGGPGVDGGGGSGPGGSGGSVSSVTGADDPRETVVDTGQLVRDAREAEVSPAVNLSALDNILNEAIYSPEPKPETKYPQQYYELNREYFASEAELIMFGRLFTPGEKAALNAAVQASTELDAAVSNEETQIHYDSPQFRPVFPGISYAGPNFADSPARHIDGLYISPQLMVELEKAGLLSEDGRKAIAGQIASRAH